MEKYTTQEDKEKPENKNKKVISNDAFAIADFLERLIKLIDHKGGLK